MRLDVEVFRRGIAESRSRARVLIAAGSVSVNGTVITKPSYECSESDDIELTGSPLEYVSRGGYKLAAALDAFGAGNGDATAGIDVTGMIAADIGASTGGFTECLLRRGACRVYAIDSGRGQLADSLHADPRVVSLEGVNARSITVDMLGELCDIVVMDVSFISQTKLHEVVASLLVPGGIFISLIKPQFEVGRENVGKGGIVRDERARQLAIEAVIKSAEYAGFTCRGIIESPITGGDGNVEYLACFILARQQET
jgi:23S rRNA (cytidine1920-2'-O)/16S rRNA (cytidine1409-2'-O)-methyltransferase